jgi:hypothetical protein
LFADVESLTLPSAGQSCEYVGPEFRLLCLDTGTIQLRDRLPPFFNQPGRLAAALGTRKHPFGMRTLSNCVI